MSDQPETAEADTPSHLRQMDAETVKHFVDRADALYDCILTSTCSMELLYAARSMSGEAQQFGLPWEGTPWTAMRLANSIEHLAKKLRKTERFWWHSWVPRWFRRLVMKLSPDSEWPVELQLAGIASGLAADIEAAVGKTMGTHE